MDSGDILSVSNIFEGPPTKKPCFALGSAVPVNEDLTPVYFSPIF